MTDVAPRDIPTLTSGAMLAPGEFCGESQVAGTRADVVARLRNADLMLIECKVSNSSVNSYKRIVRGTGRESGTLVPGARNGIYHSVCGLGWSVGRGKLETVQNAMNVYLFWQHRLSDLAELVSAAK